MTRTPAAFVCADWAKNTSGRAVWGCSVGKRFITPLSAPSGWSFASVLESLKGIASGGPTLAAFDVPIGVATGFLTSWRERVRPVATFPDLLMQVRTQPGFFEPCVAPADWRPNRPFFRVAAGPGGKQQFLDAAGANGAELMRACDYETQAKPMFAVSGIPGSVGSATASLWREIIDARDRGRSFSLWPFELERDDVTTVAEIYPRVAYKEALSYRPSRKGDRLERSTAVSSLTRADWFWRAEITLEHADLASATEDDFDACVTAAALLRRILEERPLADRIDPVAEGAMLLH